MIDGSGGPPVSDSVVITIGTRIRAAGTRAGIPIPQGSENTSAAGKFIIPALIDVRSRAVAVHASGPEAARRQVASLISRHADALELPEASAAIRDAVFEEARKARIPVFAAVSTLAQVKTLADYGVAGFIGMIRDTEDLDPAFIARLRDLRIVFAPDLAAADSEIARRNTRRLASGGVQIALAGPDSNREMGLLAAAGLSPAEVLLAATRNGAQALGKLGEIGTLEAGRRADLLVLAANPLEDVRNIRRLERVMRDGEWVGR